MRVLFCEIVPQAPELMEKYKKNNFGFKRWYQLRLEEALILDGLKQAREEGGMRPAFMPKPDGRPKRSLDPDVAAAGQPREHTLVRAESAVTAYDKHRHPVAYLPKQSTCAACSGLATTGVRCDIGTRLTPGHGKVQRPHTACKECKVHLCRKCFGDVTRWDHLRARVPERRMSGG